ncbi:MAG: FtsX-like permease family protein [Lachnospiraceae bacterium]|nr:FtsX-like permease family protein [Lachnospiraceae bacterium]MBO5176737.1 FtsX-like permease family protein [Lachnospiraceae bacterium]
MKRAQRTDLLREMKKSFNRYISIMAIMALGVAFYAGVRSSEPDMQLSAKKYLDETNYMDIRVLGTFGMTDDDVTEIRSMYGVELAEGGYQTELFLEAGQRDYQMSVYSLGNEVNQVYVTEGRVPENETECFMDRDFMQSSGYQIGDTVTLRTEEDAELSDILAVDTFTIVGAGTFPNYLSWQRGAVSIGTGVEDGFLFLPKNAFSMEVYTVVYATLKGTEELNPYGEEYENYVDDIVNRIENIADARCKIRYEEVVEPYWEDIYEAEAEIAEGEQELADAEQELADAEQKVADAELEIADAEKEIADGEKELADGEKELADAEAELLEGEQKLADAEQELEDAWAEIADGENKLDDAEEELWAGEAELEVAEWEIEDGEAELAAAELDIINGEKELAEVEAELLAAEEELKAAELELEFAGKEFPGGEEQLALVKAQLTEAKKEIEAGWKEVADGKEELAKGKAEWEAGKKKLAEARVELEKARAELEEGRKELESARAELEAGRREYEDGLAEYEKALLEWEEGWMEYEDGLEELEQAKDELEDGRAELEDAKKEVADAKQEIADAKLEIEDGKKELEDGKQELEDARAELNDIEVPEWYVLDRGTVQQLVEYGSNTERIGNLGDVFPAVFYLVAALVSLTTMTRMIEEERTQIGTMKALGYNKGAIVSKYLWYSLSATLLGGVLGVVVGSYLFPWVIIKAYSILYSNIPFILTPIQWGLAGASVLIAVICTVVATMSSCYKEMIAAPAILMRPVAPPVGRRVFLEYIKPLWNALSFSWKATCRNLFRYKKRFFMTIFGIGGCMALLLVGFGLRDSIMEIVNKQYKEIWTYDAYLSISDENISLEEKEHGAAVEEQLLIQTKNMDVESAEAQVSATLFVPKELKGLNHFVQLRDRNTKEEYTLTEKNVIITEKLAKLLEVSVGDTIDLYYDDITKYSVEVTEIAENYMLHYVYMSAELYEDLFGEVPEYNQLYLRTKQMSEEDKESFSGEMLSDDKVDSVTYVEELQESVSVMMKSLELVVVVLIIAAGMLAFIVLYNLNNINIIERRRELATLKVLGFYDVEVANYVYRENVLLTIIGIFAGAVMGFFLHRFVILTVEVDMMMFGREIEGPSYLFSVLLTCTFAVLINFGMFYKLRKIDMVESLKSAE